MNFISIDETDAYAIVSGVLLKSLKRLGWQGDEVEDRLKELHLTVLRALDQARERVDHELNAYASQFGFDEQALQGLARTEYAMIGFDLASKLDRRRQSLCN